MDITRTIGASLQEIMRSYGVRNDEKLKQPV